jgi:hypothetical protein
MEIGMKSLRAAAVAVLALAAAADDGAAPAGAACSAHSPARRVALVELYSSEGCSSCPPAERWLGQWRDGGSGAGVVPLALHVDYWNSLGWTDRFSQHRFTERQEALAAYAGGHLIYTPEVFVAGRELGDWATPGSLDARLRELAAQPAQADVAIGLARAASGANALEVDARFAARPGAPSALNAYVAVYENALSSEVDAGENRGATLHHDRVVRAWLGPVPLVAGVARIHRDVALDDPLAGAPPGRFGAAAFVEDARTGDVLQAADRPACSGGG